MILMWIIFILLYLIFNTNIVIAMLATDDGRVDTQTKVLMVILGVFFGLPLLLIFGIVALVVASVRLVSAEYYVAHAKKLYEQREEIQ